MKKIPNLFERDWNGNKSRVLPELHKDADVAWVLAGEGIPTVKWDGSAVMVNAWGVLFVRYDWKFNKKTKKKPPMPNGFIPSQDADPVTGHHPGWIPAFGNPAAKWHLEALENYRKLNGDPKNGTTLEAVGPHHQTNPYHLDEDFLFCHGQDPIQELVGFSYGGPNSKIEAFHNALKTFLSKFHFKRRPMTRAQTIEGIVWHHPDGRMVKALASDLGIEWKAKTR